MLKNLQKKKDRQQGFTIIEVLIVLAIAGLILLIVFLAVPALQRNSRDTQRRNDVSRLLGASQEVINNNGGDITKLTATNVVTAAGTLAYYLGTNVSVGAYASPTSPAAPSDNDHVVIVTGGTCSSNALAQGSTRQIALLYKIESGNGTAQCTGS
jgi:prepilin-type N-terminal cleavage/methylation domain-containing protein